jgi:two-component system, chemotaxis family, chemotaxis protein CheY
MQPSATTLVESNPTGKTLRILYVDDVIELRELMQLMLSQDGHSVEPAINGVQALKKLAENPGVFDVVITDHHMPKMDGLELVRRLRALEFPGRIMVFSSELSPSIADGYADLRVDHFLTKPVSPAVLREKLAAF